MDSSHSSSPNVTPLEWVTQEDAEAEVATLEMESCLLFRFLEFSVCDVDSSGTLSMDNEGWDVKEMLTQE